MCPNVCIIVLYAPPLSLIIILLCIVKYFDISSNRIYCLTLAGYKLAQWAGSFQEETELLDVLLKLYTGEKSWNDHFDSIATVCEWDDAASLKWMRVRLLGRAGTAFRRLHEQVCGDFRQASAELR